MTLQSLQELGCLSSNLEVCHKYKATSYSEFRKCSDDEKKKVKAVVLDNSVWVATPNREPTVRADVVYSYDGTNFGLWNRQLHSFSIMELVNDSLVATKNISLMEGDSNMSEQKLDLGGSLAEEMAAEAKKTAAAPQKMDVEGVGTPSAKKSDSEKAAEKAARDARKKQKEHALEEQASAIKAIAQRSGTTFKVNPKFVDNNRKYGRFIGFVTASDPVIKLSLKQTPINFGTPGNPKYQLRAGVTLDPETQKRFQGGVKNIGAKYLECKTDIVVRQAGPGSIVAGIVKTPAMTELTSYDDVTQARDFTADCVENHTTVLKVLPKEALFPYLELNYDKKIPEDESIAGNTMLAVKSTEVKSKGASKGTSAPIKQFRTRIVAEGRSLFTAGNYFPIETYDTVSLSYATEEDKVLANNNFAALMKQLNAKPVQRANGQFSAPKGELSEEAKAMFSVDEANSDPSKALYSCSSSIVNGGAIIQCKPFGAKKNEELMIDVTALPVRETKENKDGTTTNYRYRKSKFNEGNDPAINRNEYADFINRVTAAADGVNFETIINKAKKASRSASKPKASTSVADRISGLEMLALRSANDVKVDGTNSIADIFEAFRNAQV